MHNLAFLTLLIGLLLVYCEFIWVGKIYFGIFGAGISLLALRSLWLAPRTDLGEVLIFTSITCYAIRNLIARTAGTLLLAFGSWKLFPEPHTIPAKIAFPAAVTFGLITQFLLVIADRARVNKRADL